MKPTICSDWSTAASHLTNEVGAHLTSHSRSGGITRLGESEADVEQQLQPGNEFCFDSVRTQAAALKLGCGHQWKPCIRATP